MSPGQLLASFKKKELRLLGLREKNKTISAGFNCSRQQKCCLYMKGSGILHMNSVKIIYECEAADRILYLFSLTVRILQMDQVGTRNGGRHLTAV